MPKKTVSERELQKAIIEAARLLGWRVAHFRTAMNARGHHMTPVTADGKGFPDLCLVRERVVFAEIKVAYGKLTEEQAEWRDSILNAGGEWHLWREADWEDGTVDRVLYPSRE